MPDLGRKKAQESSEAGEGGGGIKHKPNRGKGKRYSSYPKPAKEHLGGTVFRERHEAPKKIPCK